MPALDLAFLQSLEYPPDRPLEFYSDFVETGTYRGDTIFRMEPHFEHLYTVEVHGMHYAQTRARYSGDKITFFHGDSAVVFRTLLPTLHYPAVFFLDGHWSAGNTGRADQDVPLLDELAAICTGFQPEALVIVDDCRLFGKGPTRGDELVDWENVSVDAVLERVRPRLMAHYFRPSHLHPQDRLILRLAALPQWEPETR